MSIKVDQIKMANQSVGKYDFRNHNGVQKSIQGTPPEIQVWTCSVLFRNTQGLYVKVTAFVMLFAFCRSAGIDYTNRVPFLSDIMGSIAQYAIIFWVKIETTSDLIQAYHKYSFLSYKMILYYLLNCYCIDWN